jgi:hypothetical protein
MPTVKPLNKNEIGNLYAAIEKAALHLPGNSAEENAKLDRQRHKNIATMQRVSAMSRQLQREQTPKQGFMP